MNNDVLCPVRGHTHRIPLTPHPVKKNRVVGICNGRAVIEKDVDLDDGFEDMTIPELKNTVEWQSIPSPKPFTKSKIIAALRAVRGTKSE